MEPTVLVPLTQRQLHQILGKLGGLPEFRSIRPREGQFTAIEHMSLVEHLTGFHETIIEPKEPCNDQIQSDD